MCIIIMTILEVDIGEIRTLENINSFSNAMQSTDTVVTIPFKKSRFPKGNLIMFNYSINFCSSLVWNKIMECANLMQQIYLHHFRFISFLLLLLRSVSWSITIKNSVVF